MATTTRASIRRVSLDASVARLARLVAAYKGVRPADYLNEALRPIVERDLIRETERCWGKRPGRDVEDAAAEWLDEREAREGLDDGPAL